MLQRLHLAHSPSRRLIALVVSSHTLRVWVNPEGQDEQASPELSCALELQTGHVDILGLQFLDDHSLVCVHANGAIQLWSFDSLEAHTNGEALERARSSSPPLDARQVGVGLFNDCLADPAQILTCPSATSCAMLCWEILLDRRLKSADFIVHPETGMMYAAFGGVTGHVFWMSLSPSFHPLTRCLGNLGSCVNLTSLSHEGGLIATSCRDHRVAIWRPLQEESDGTPWRLFDESSAEIWALAFSHSSRYLAGGGIDNGVYLWDLYATPSLRAKRFDHSGWISDLAWSDNDRVLASASWDNSVGVYRGSDLMPLYRLELHSDYVSSVMFVPDSTLLVSASYDQQLAVWDWSQAALVRVFDDHEDWIQALLPGQDGMFLSASSDRCVYLWQSSPLTLRSKLVEGELERVPLRQGQGITEQMFPVMAVRADASPSDVTHALSKALDLSPPQSLESHLPSLDASSSPTQQRLLDHEGAGANPPPYSYPVGQNDQEEQTENFSVRKLAESSEDEFSAAKDAALDRELSEIMPWQPFGTRTLTIEGSSLSSGRLRSPLREDESGVHNLQEMSLAVDAVDVFKLIDNHSSSIVIVPQSEAFTSSHIARSPASPSAEKEPTKELSRDALKMLFRRHLDGEVEQSAPSSVAPEADESSNLELSPEEISQSLFGDLTEVFEDSLHHYMQNRQASQAPEMEHSAFVAEDPVPQDVVEHESGSDDDGVELSESLLEVRPPEPADNKASLSLGAEDLPEPPLAAKSDSEESLVSTLDQALSTPLGEALKAAQEEAEVQALLKQAPATAGNEAVEEQSVPADTDPFERIESSLVRAADPVEDPMVEVSTPLTDEGEPISQSSLSDDDDAREDSEIRASDGLPEPSASESAELQESSDAEDAEGASDEEDSSLEQSEDVPDDEVATQAIDENVEVGRLTVDEHGSGLSEMLSSSPEVVMPIMQEPASDFSEALLGKDSDRAEEPNPFTREESPTVVDEHGMLSAQLLHGAKSDVNLDVEVPEEEREQLAQVSVNLEDQEFFATPPQEEEPVLAKALPQDEWTALADAMSLAEGSEKSDSSSSFSEDAQGEAIPEPNFELVEPSTPLNQDSSATVMNAGATQAAQALLLGQSMDEAFASLSDEPASTLAKKTLPHEPLQSESSEALQEHVFPGAVDAAEEPVHILSDEDSLPSADDAPTMAGSAHPSNTGNVNLSPEMATLIADEESDDWYVSAQPVAVDERTVAENVAPPGSSKEVGDLPTNPGNVRERTSSSGHPFPLHANQDSHAPHTFSQEERKRSQTRDSRPNPSDYTNPGVFASENNERSGAAPFIGRPATASGRYDEVSANTTSFGGIVYRPELAEEPELGGNEITADAFTDPDGSISEPISQSEFVSHTPEWDVVEPADLWQMRHQANQSAMKIFKRRASVSRQPWNRKDPIRANLHNVFAACSRSDADYFAAGGATRHLSVWSFKEELIYQLPATGRIIYALTATPDGRILLSGDDRANIDLWLVDFDDMGRGVPRLKRARLSGHTAPISHLATNSSGRLLLSAGLDGTARLWNLEEGGCVSVLDHYGESLSACDFWGAGLVSVSLEGVLRLWDRRGIQIDLVEGFSPLTAVVAKRNKIYFGARSGEVFCYERGQTRSLGRHDAEVSGMSLHLDGTLITASRDGSIKIHYDQGQSTNTLQARAPLTCIDIDNSRIIAGTENGNVEIFRQS